MAKCNRAGVIYKRHQWKDTVCAACGDTREILDLSELPLIQEIAHDIAQTDAFDNEGGANPV